jgi:hypothetical protein
MNQSNIYFEDQSSFSKEQTDNNKVVESKDVKPSTDEIFKFLNIKVTTILTFSMAIAIGFALKDLMNVLVVNIIQPSIMSLIMYFDKNNYLPITQGLREKEVSIDVAKFLGSMLVVKIVIAGMYFLDKYSSILF